MARKKSKYKFLLWFKKIENKHLIIVGLILISVFALWRYNRVRILSFKTSEVSVSLATGVKPVHIRSYPVGIDIDIEETIINNGVWIIPQKKAGHLSSSSGINGGGNIIVYGHNRNNILGPLRWIKNGAEIELTGDDGKKYLYYVTSINEVDPDNLEYIQNTDTEVLTVYTCSGFLDSKRFIVVAKPLLSPHQLGESSED